MARDKGKHEAGKHARTGEPKAGKGGKKPKPGDVQASWPTGAPMARQTKGLFNWLTGRLLNSW